MKISRPWLQKFFDAQLPDAKAIAEALTFHAFEIESVENDVLDVKITANRGHDCLSHRGIAKELAAILNIPLSNDRLDTPAELSPHTDRVSVDIREQDLCPRYIAGYIRNVKVGSSPEWLRERLEALGQKSINNVVDATNYVMFHLGQPLHAFDAGKLSDRDGTYAIAVRRANDGEKIVTLDGKEYTLASSMLLITDAHSEMPIGIAGVKGGAPAAIDEDTTDIIIESANFNGVSVRKTSQMLKLRTDASSRFEQVISPEMAAYGMRAVVQRILELAGGELVGFVDEYPKPQQQKTVSVSLEKINRVLGTQFSADDVADVFTRLMFSFSEKDGVFTVQPPFERLDLVIPEDLVEEVGRIIGYDHVAADQLPPISKAPAINQNFYSAERAREDLIAKGYSEVFTSVFAENGDRVVANKVDGVRPFLRSTLVDGLKDAYERNMRTKELLGLKEVRIFEIGTVWKGGTEVTMLGLADTSGVREEEVPIVNAPDHYDNLPVSQAVRYQPFSKYPFIVRDISMWVPDNAQSFTEVVQIFAEHAQGLLRHVDLFDQFQKGDRISYAFHLVFQSFDRTLTDAEVNAIMETISHSVTQKGFEVR
ncbi:MAG TPA: phenylalanine--tRNA ligase subunit beta [Candidatus Paceibacterota bacterium]|nr:phenylalanine--tRNA ligase subunit beta [Candidatus Paceibacterota bacterium]